jgi:hypothetical protein
MKFFFLIILLISKTLSVKAFDYKPPTSDVQTSEQGIYQLPCSLNQIAFSDIESLTYSAFDYNFDNTTEYAIIASKLMYRGGELGPQPQQHIFLVNSENQSDDSNAQEAVKLIPHGTEVTAKCSDNTYVFEFQDASKRDLQPKKPKQTFTLKCDNGSLERVDKNAFCDKKCDILPLKAKQYKLFYDILFPGQSANVYCPEGFKTIENQEYFTVTCIQNGFINGKSPKCLDEATSCLFQGKLYEDGFQLQCSGNNNIGLVIASCNKGSWTKDDNICDQNCFDQCKASFGDINFEYENLNEIIDFETEKEMTIIEIEDYCKNPDGTIKAECKPQNKFCKYDNISYAHDVTISLNCKDKIRHFICYGGTFIHDANAYNSSNTNILPVDINNELCKNATLVAKETPDESVRSNLEFLNPLSYKDYKLKLYRERNKSNK